MTCVVVMQGRNKWRPSPFSLGLQPSYDCGMAQRTERLVDGLTCVVIRGTGRVGTGQRACRQRANMQTVVLTFVSIFPKV